MDTARATFAPGEDGDPDEAIAVLERLGFEFATSRRVGRTLLDTFDGRLAAAGLRAEWRQGDRAELIVSGPGTPSAAVALDAVPTSPADVPAGPLRARLAAVTEVRALLPVVAISAAVTDGAWRDRSGKTVATSSLHRDIDVDGHPDAELVPWTVEIAELTGYPKKAVTAGVALRELGLVQLGDETVVVAATAAGISLSGTRFEPTVPLDAEMPAAEGVRLVLANLADTIDGNWRGTIDDVDPEFLHDLRVAVRRTRSVLRQCKRSLPSTVVEWASERFGWLAGETGRARDLDVYLIEWDTYTSPLGLTVVDALHPVRQLLGRHRAEAATRLTATLRSSEATALLGEWRSWLRQPVAGDDLGDRADERLGWLVAARLQQVHDDLVRDGRAIGPETPGSEVHELRKDAKKLRYLIECFGSLLPSSARAPFVKQLKKLQDNLGEHQDAEVHVAELRVMAHDLHDTGAAPDTMTAIGQLAEQLDQRRLAARAAFAEEFDAFDSTSTRRSLAAVVEALDG